MANQPGDVHYDVCIVGAGMAGLSAALILGRCLRRVIVFDSGKPRNFASRGLHGFLSRDGIHPLKLRELGREELARYDNVEVRDEEIVAAHRHEHGFELRRRQGDAVQARALLLATGRSDLLPEKPGFRELYGRGVYHCPICDAWEYRGESFAVLGDADSVEHALALCTWSREVTLCTDGPARLEHGERERLSRQGVIVEERAVEAALPDGVGELRALQLAGGATLACRAVFFDADCVQKSPLAENLGCTLDHTGAVVCDGPAAKGVPHLFVAGNVRRGIHLAITAAAEGVEAALAIHYALAKRHGREPHDID